MVDIKFNFIKDKLKSYGINNRLNILEDFSYYKGIIYDVNLKEDIIYLLSNELLLNIFRLDRKIEEEIKYILIINKKLIYLNDSNIDYKLKYIAADTFGENLIIENLKCIICDDKQTNNIIKCDNCLNLLCLKCFNKLDKCGFCGAKKIINDDIGDLIEKFIKNIICK
jgi:hypothetical protein